MSLKQKYKDKIIALICAMMPNVNIYFLGSGTKKIDYERSNINIALKGKEAQDRYQVDELRSILQATNIPYTIDLVDYYGVSTDMRVLIDKDGILWKRAINVVTREKIEEVKNRLVKTYNPLEIYLFGSYVWGNPTKASDLDLLIVVEKSDEKSYKRSIIGSEALMGIKVPTDLLVYTKKEFEGLAEHVSSLCYKIKKEGDRIYAVA